MKYIKTFELVTGNALDYDSGDIVTCTTTAKPRWWKGVISSTIIKGEKYKVVKVYEIPEDKFMNNDYCRVDVEDLETGEVSKGWESTRFKLEMESDAEMFNI